MATALPFIAIASTVASAGLGIVGAVRQSRAASYEREQLETEAKAIELAAQQDENARRENLRRVLASQEAIRAGAGLQLETGTSRAIANRSVDATEDDIITSRFNFMRRAQRTRAAAFGAGQRGTNALFAGGAGILSAAGRSAVQIQRMT